MVAEKLDESLKVTREITTHGAHEDNLLHEQDYQLRRGRKGSDKLGMC